MARRPPSSVQLVQTIPRGDLKSKAKINKKFSAIRRKKNMSPEEVERLASLVVEVRSGSIPSAQQEAILAESVALLQKGPFAKYWTTFFNKYGGDQLVSLDFNEFDRPWAFLPFPSVKHKKSDAEAKFNFVRVGDTLAVDIHMADKKGQYVGTVRKAVAPFKVLVKGGKSNRDHRHMQTVMITAGIQRHAKDMLADALGVSPGTMSPPDSGWELNAQLTPVEVLRGSPVFMDVEWPKGLAVRTLFGELNKKRVSTVSEIIRENWFTRFAPGRPGHEARAALARITDILRERRGYNARQVREVFSSAVGHTLSPRDFEELMYELD